MHRFVSYPRLSTVGPRHRATIAAEPRVRHLSLPFALRAHAQMITQHHAALRFEPQPKPAPAVPGGPLEAQSSGPAHRLIPYAAPSPDGQGLAPSHTAPCPALSAAHERSVLSLAPCDKRYASRYTGLYRPLHGPLPKYTPTRDMPSPSRALHPPVRLAAPARALLSIMHRSLARPRLTQWHALAATGRGPAAQLLFQAQSGPSPCTRPPARPPPAAHAPTSPYSCVR